MDLNDLLSRHQISLMLADASACGVSRATHLIAADDYVAQIRDLQRTNGARVPVIAA